MKQVFQDIKSGETKVEDLPIPQSKNGEVLINSSKTLISSGTEKMLLEFGNANFIDKARQQPDKVKMVLDKIKSDGIKPTIEAVFNKLDKPLPLGYCNVGKVIENHSKKSSLKAGDRVISNGSHAEIVSVPVNLCAKIPDNVTDDEAAFTVLGAIALQGIRLTKPTLGESIVVIGLGLVGLMTVQLLKANGTRVLAIDFDKKRLKLAKSFGADIVDLSSGEDPIIASKAFSKNRGVDGVIIAASTNKNEPIHQAAQMCRKRGRIVLVGVTGLKISRDDFYEKELTFQVSASYGPGRYDPNYEQKGQDYPFGFVRWTEQRNFEAVLDMMSEGKLNVKPLISHRFDINEAADAYEILLNNEHHLGILLNYQQNNLDSEPNIISFDTNRISTSNDFEISASFIGAGDYANSTLIPAFKKAKVNLQNIVSNTGVSSFHVGKKHGFRATSTDPETIFSDDKTNIVIISTQHDSHAKYVLDSIKSGKNVFVEKPLCLTEEELKEIESEYSIIANDESKKTPVLMVGFNRRFSPHIIKIKDILKPIKEPKSFVMTVNAGDIPSDHWIHDSEKGGGRLIGEGCHFIDLLRFLAESKIKNWDISTMNSENNDTFSLNFNFDNGSIGTIHYFSNGSKSFPKERLEIFSGNKILQLDNFRRLRGYGFKNFKSMNTWNQDKGQNMCAKAFVDSVKNANSAPISFEEIIEVSRITISIANNMRINK